MGKELKSALTLKAEMYAAIFLMSFSNVLEFFPFVGPGTAFYIWGVLSPWMPETRF